MTVPTKRPGPGSEKSGTYNPVIRELTLDAMVRDEIVQLTMASDGVSEEDILSLRQIVPLVDRDTAA
jgi:hypothetical protein